MNRKKLTLALALTLGAVSIAAAQSFEMRVYSQGLLPQGAPTTSPPSPSPAPAPAPTPAPEATFALEGSFDFATVAQGQRTSRTFTVKNTSTKTSLQVRDVAVVGAGVSLAPGSTGTPCATEMPQSLAPEASCTFTLTWAPTVAGPLTNAHLTFVSNAADSPRQYSLTGSAEIPADPYFSKVTLLLPFEGTGDVKGNAVSSAGATLSSQAAHSGNSSAFFGAGVGHVVKIENTAPFDLPGDFTVEGWVLPVDGATNHVFAIGGIDGKTWQSQGLWMAGSRFVFNASSNNTVNDIAANLDIGAVMAGQWNHFAITRHGAVYRTFVNGALTKTIAVNKRPYKPQYGLVLGNYAVKTWTSFPGTWAPKYIDDFRVTNGVARYTESFTPSHVAFPTR